MACDKRSYLTQAQAEVELANQRRKFTERKGKGSDVRFLKAYQCHCGFWHLGRDWKTRRKNIKHAEMQAKAEAKQNKLPSFGELRRKVERMEREWTRKEDYQRRQRAAAIAKLVEADRAIWEAEQEYIRIQREVFALFFPNH